MNNTIGIYYELPHGTIAYVCGIHMKKEKVEFILNDDCGERIAMFHEFNKWKPRQDLQDFPDSKDPVLPYDFDLIYDIKRQSQLIRKYNDFKANLHDRKDFEDMIDQHNLRHLVGERIKTDGEKLKDALDDNKAKAELYRTQDGETECLFVGTTEDCNSAKKILDEYHKYDLGSWSIGVRESIEGGTEQEYITKVLDETIDFEYGY